MFICGVLVDSVPLIPLTHTLLTLFYPCKILKMDSHEANNHNAEDLTLYMMIKMKLNKLAREKCHNNFLTDHENIF